MASRSQHAEPKFLHHQQPATRNQELGTSAILENTTVNAVVFSWMVPPSVILIPAQSTKQIGASGNLCPTSLTTGAAHPGHPTGGPPRTGGGSVA